MENKTADLNFGEKDLSIIESKVGSNELPSANEYDIER